MRRQWSKSVGAGMSAFPDLDALVRECDDTEAAGITRRDGVPPEPRNWRKRKSRRAELEEMAAAMLRANTTQGSGCVARRRGIEKRTGK